MSLSDDLRRLEQHGKYIAWKPDSGEPQPAPGFKDCENCRIAKFATTEDARRAICRECPYADLPCGPSLAFRVASKWARLPDSVVSRYAEDLELNVLQNIGELQHYRQARMMGARILGR